LKENKKTRMSQQNMRAYTQPKRKDVVRGEISWNTAIVYIDIVMPILIS
jgi:hypothetical protein